MKRFIAIFSLIALLAGTANAAGPKEGGGTLLGAGAGALIGSQFGGGTGRLVGVAIGTLAGALIGQDIGRTLDRTDQVYMQQTAQQTLETLPSNQTSTWVNPDTGNRGAVTPTRTYQAPDGRYCREYQQTVIVGGQQQQAYGTACRQPDGSWQIVSNAEPQRQQQQVVVQRPARVYVQEPVYVPSYRPYAYWPFPTFLSFSYSRSSGHYDGWGHHDGRRHHRHWDD